MSHSKRNTSLAFFTAHERDEVKGTWGSKSARLARDSFLPFGSCQLCLLPARDPVACPGHGHLFCRECAVSNLLAQHQERKRLQKDAERRRAEAAEDRQYEDAQVHARAVAEFETVQAGLSARPGAAASAEAIAGRSNGRIAGSITAGRSNGSTHGNTAAEHEVKPAPKGTKRKFEIDPDELARRARDEGDKAKKLMADEKQKAQLPSFWLPSQTPHAEKSDAPAAKQTPTCPAAEADQPHEFSLKALVAVRFSGDASERHAAAATAHSCPSCHKALTNATKAVLAKPCGHVLCRPCSDRFQRAPVPSPLDREHGDSVRCYVCHEDVTPRNKAKRKKDPAGGGRDGPAARGLVELSTDGTGFARAGKSEVKKQGVVFQC